MRSGNRSLVARWRLRWLLWTGRTQQAIDWLTEHLQRQPEDTHALASLGYLQAQADRLDEAADALERLVRLDPVNAHGWFNLGFVREQQGQDLDAMNAFERAVRVDDRHDRAWFGLGQTLARMERHTDAIAAFSRNTALQPMSPHGWQALALAQAQCGNLEEAWRLCRHLQAFEPRHASRLQTQLEHPELAAGPSGQVASSDNRGVTPLPPT